jgi:hypothetical protein
MHYFYDLESGKIGSLVTVSIPLPTVVRRRIPLNFENPFIIAKTQHVEELVTIRN